MLEQEEKLWNRNYIKVWVANFMIFFSFMLLMPLLPIYLKERFGANNDIIGTVLSGYVIMALLSRMFSGYIVDSFPRKKVLLISYFLFFLFFTGYIVAGTLLLFALVRTLHGAPFGSVTVANSTVAIDVLPSSRRAEGIGYYGLSNNIATAISPSIALWIYHLTNNFNLIFLAAVGTSFIGFLVSSTVKIPPKELKKEKSPISLDRFFLSSAWKVSVSFLCLAFSYGVLSTYVAIYGQEKLDIKEGTGFFFMLLAIGLIVSRLLGSRSLREGRVAHNAGLGCLVSLFGYLLFAALHNEIGYYGAAFIIGLGNGHMFPAYQTMFLNLAEHSQRGTANSSHLVSWDIGVGLGILAGGFISRHLGYHEAFWVAWLVNLIGVACFFFIVKKFYLKHKLR